MRERYQRHGGKEPRAGGTTGESPPAGGGSGGTKHRRVTFPLDGSGRRKTRNNGFRPLVGWELDSFPFRPSSRRHRPELKGCRRVPLGRPIIRSAGPCLRSVCEKVSFKMTSRWPSGGSGQFTRKQMNPRLVLHSPLSSFFTLCPTKATVLGVEGT